MWPKRHQKESHEKKGLYEFRIYIYIIYILYMKPVVNYVRKVHHLEDVCIS